MTETNTEHLLNDIDKRLTLVEAELGRMAGTRRLTVGILAAIILQAAAGAVGYGQLLQMVEESTDPNVHAQEMLKLQYHLENHPDIQNRFDRRITRIETLVEIMIQNQERMLQRNNSLHNRIENNQ